MNPYPILVAIVLFVASLGGAYFKGAHDNEAKAIERERNGLIAYAERIKTAQETHDNDQTTITRLAADLSRVRVHIPTCPASESTNGGSGVFSAAVDEEFGRLQARVSQIVQRCDQLNIDAIRLNGELYGRAQ